MPAERRSLSRILPFLRWFPLRAETLKADLVAGITVALVLIPQSMAYAQLAGLPAYFGLYAAFLPVMLAALFGSSNQLATGPVAVVSLLTASALIPLAAVGSEQFVALAIVLAFLAGVVQLMLGVFKLGSIVNFISHPVIAGFINAAAIIIGLSQLNKLMGVTTSRSDYFLQDIWGVISQAGYTHLPTLVMGLSALIGMWLLRKYYPKVPGVLVAVLVATLISWLTGFELNGSAHVTQITDPVIKSMAEEYSRTEAMINDWEKEITAKTSALRTLQRSESGNNASIAKLNYETELLKLQQHDAAQENRKRQRSLRKFVFVLEPAANNDPGKLYLFNQTPTGIKTDGHRWRIKSIKQGEIKLIGGGEVVGKVPSGLPRISVPPLSWDLFQTLISGAFLISVVGFMEAISMAKAMAAKTKQRVDPNQELIGQGIANIVGSFSQSYPVSGSFSRSAVNLNAGAITGMASVFTGLIVLISLLFLTPLLYHLPQAVLAAIIMLAVTGLINFKAFKHAWKANRHDGIAAVVTFFATLALAPHLDKGILIGASLALILYLLRTMKPRVAILGRHPDGTLRDAKVHNLPTSEHIVAVRFDGSLYFANVPLFEDAILEAISNHPKAKFILVVGDGINQLDASGEEIIHHLVQALRENGISIVFSGLKQQVLQVMENTGLYSYIGAENFYRTVDTALDAIYQAINDESFDAKFCPLTRKESELHVRE